MKTILLKACFCVLAALIPAIMNAVELNRQYEELPLGTIKPDGWLREMLIRQRNGITANLDKVYPQVVGERNGWLGGDGDQWERGPYWIDGLLPMAYILDDDDLKAKAQQWIEWALASQQENGQFGPVKDYPVEPGIQRTKAEDWWPRMVMLKVLQQYYNATGDERVLKFMDKYFRYQLKTLPDKRLDHWTYWSLYRACDNMLVALWLYQKTGQEYLLELCGLLHGQGHDFTRMFLETEELGQISSIHCVNLAQGLKEPIVYWQMNPEQKYLDAVKKCFSDLRVHAGYPNGMYGGDESLHGNNPVQGVELCSIVEMMYSLEEMLKITGSTAFADHLERVAFNALPTQMTDDFKEHQYFQQTNQISITRGPHNFDNVYDGTSSLMGVLCGFPCCLCNLHQAWPKFTQNLWYATKDGGLAAMTYAPCHFTTKIDGVEVSISENTYYPMDGKIVVEVSMPARKSASIPFSFRIPTWTSAASINVCGETLSVEAGTVTVIDRKWKNGDKIILDFPMSIKLDKWYENSVAVERGPLVYALKIDEKWEKVSLDPSERKGDYYWQVTAGSPWNYALPFNVYKTPEKYFIVEINQEKLTNNWYWSPENSPITLTVQAGIVEEWHIYNGDTGPLPFTAQRSRVSQNKSSLVPDGKLSSVELIPYGCTTLRITEFPLITR